MLIQLDLNMNDAQAFFTTAPTTSQTLRDFGKH